MNEEKSRFPKNSKPPTTHHSNCPCILVAPGPLSFRGYTLLLFTARPASPGVCVADKHRDGLLQLACPSEGGARTGR